MSLIYYALLVVVILLLVLGSFFWVLCYALMVSKSTLVIVYEFFIDAHFEALTIIENSRMASSWRDDQRRRLDEWKEKSMWQKFTDEVPRPELRSSKKKTQ